MILLLNTEKYSKKKKHLQAISYHVAIMKNSALNSSFIILLMLRKTSARNIYIIILLPFVTEMNKFSPICLEFPTIFVPEILFLASIKSSS